MTIASHTIGDVPALEQVLRLRNNGVSPKAWIWTHAQSGSLEANLEAASEGAWIALDNVNADADNIEWYAQRIEAIKNEGFLDQILISHDAGWYDVGEPEGGDFRGYTDIFEFLLPELSERGFSEDEIHQLLVKNPQKAFSLRVRELD
jgi:phosphotriesterase-related protein